MKANSNPRFLPSLLLSLALAAVPANAQEPTPDLSPAERETVPTTPEQFTLVVGVTVIPQAVFKDATLGEVAEFLSQKSGVNLMISSEAKKLKVPDMNLRNVTGIGVLRAISSTGVPFQVTETAPQTPGDSSVWVIVGTDPSNVDRPNLTRIFNLRHAPPLPSGGNNSESPENFQIMVQEITDAAFTALAAHRQASKSTEVDFPVVKIHPSTRLLILSGKPEEVEIAHQVICVLGGQPAN